MPCESARLRTFSSSGPDLQAKSLTLARRRATCSAQAVKTLYGPVRAFWLWVRAYGLAADQIPSPETNLSEFFMRGFSIAMLLILAGLSLPVAAQLMDLVNDRMARAERGDAEAQFELGIMYENGEGLPEDHSEAANWYRKAAEQGHAQAQLFLGLMYEEGKGLPEDHAEAANWYGKAAEQGETVAQGRLSVMYVTGIGVRQDYVEAYAWANIAAARGDDFSQAAKKFKVALAKEMTSAQIAEAQALSREYWTAYGPQATKD